VTTRPVRRPELAELETFAAAAREGSIARAAMALHLTTAGAAKRIDALETIVGVRLLERGPRGVTLTQAGRRFLPQAERFLAESEAMLATVSELRQGGPPLRIEGLQELTGNRPAPSTEAVLADRETLFAAMFHASGDGILIARRREEIIDLNDATCTILGHPRERLLGRTDSDLGLWRSPDERSAVADSTGPLARPRCRRGPVRREGPAPAGLSSRAGLLLSTTGICERRALPGATPSKGDPRCEPRSSSPPPARRSPLQRPPPPLRTASPTRRRERRARPSSR
jgi:DNA-binding transcriptional LysR family regulator